MNKRILLVGGGGHCKSVLDSLLAYDDFEIGIVDKEENIGNFVLGVPVLGCDNDLQHLYSMGYRNAFVTIGSIGNPRKRIEIFELLLKIGFEISNIIDPSAEVSKYADIDYGIFIGKKAVVNAGACIKRGSIINTGSIIEHDCQIGEFVHIAPGTILGGRVKVGMNSHIGSNSTIIQNVKIGSNTIIGIGSVVTKSIGDSIMAYGNPCREVKKL